VRAAPFALNKAVWRPDYGLFLVARNLHLVQDGKRKDRRGFMRGLLVLLLKDRRGQDLIEYALLAATIAIVVAGFLPPAVMPSVSTIFSKISSSMAVS
jgi:Flp pilus assembly pilin Flp